MCMIWCTMQVQAVMADKESAVAAADSALSQTEAQLAALAESQGRMAQQCDALSQELQGARQESARILQESEVRPCVHASMERFKLLHVKLQDQYRATCKSKAGVLAVGCPHGIHERPVLISV